ncbi:MAG: hypothetical protein JXQ73_23595 [Phycisphaerae bacterium]|nr:hypothetical protein [Phycisphaerae bacterium]
MLNSKTKRRIKTAHTVLFFLVFVDALAAFGFFMVIRSSAIEAPADDQIAPLRDHGNTFYITPARARVYRALMIVMTVGIPLVVVSGVVLEFGLGIPVLRAGARANETAEPPENRQDE